MFNGFDHGFLTAHGRSKQSGDSDDVRSQVGGCGGKVVAGDVYPQIVYLKSMGRQQGADKRLANFMDVTLGRA